MKCPVDNIDLLMTDRQGIEIDYCPQCRGVWLDRGELDKIIERSAATQAPPTVPPPSAGGRDLRQEYREPLYHDKAIRRDYDDDDDHRYYKRRKKRDSFLDDLFDF